MAHQTVYEFRSSTRRQPAASAAPFLRSDNVVSICDSPIFSRNQVPEITEPNPDGLGCARGLRTAFLCEAGVLLFAYGLWQVIVHLIR